METVIVNQKKLELYRNCFSYYFVLETIDTVYEGEIIIGSGEHGGETYPYVSHIEFSSDDELDDVEQENFEKWLDDNLELVFNSEQI